MAPTREERIQHRLRGAQRRQVKDVDFGLSFPAASAAPEQAPVLRRTPQPELSPQRSSRRTPASRGRGRPSRATLGEESKEVVINTASNANISAKRRKLRSDETPSSSTRSTRSSLHVSKADIYDLPEDREQEPHIEDTTIGSISQDTVPEHGDEPESAKSLPGLKMARTPSQIAPVLEEITESPTDAPGSGHRVRVSLDRAALQSSQLQEVLQVDASPTAPRYVGLPGLLSKRKRGETTPKQLAQSTKRIRRSPRRQTSPALDELDELSPEQSQREHSSLHSADKLDELSPELPKQGSQRSHRFEEVELDELSPQQSIHNARRAEDKASNIEEEFTDDISEAEQINDQEAASILNKNRGRRISRYISTAESPDLDEVTEPTPPTSKKKTKTRPVSTPAQQRQPKKPNPRSSGVSARQPSAKVSKHSKARARSPIPVIVHRFTKRPLYDKDQADADILNDDIAYTKRSGVNAIDVLSQVCQETIDSALETLERGRLNSDDPSLRREYGTKLRAIEIFGNELQTRLLEHTINLENTFSLQKRVRDEQKKKLAFREEILRVRSEREQVALRMDEIRIRHENESKAAQERDGLNTDIHDIELAVERGKAHGSHTENGALEMAGIELPLKRVARQVSNKSDSGGMLKQIKDFNAFLERAALVLEGRKS